MKIKFFLQMFALSLLVFHSNNVFSQNDNTADRKSYLTKVQISETDKIKVFNNLWETVNRLYFDQTFNGNNWVKLCEIYLPQAVAIRGNKTAKGVRLEGRGVAPDIEVPLSVKDFRKQRDAILEKALESLKKL